MGQRNEMKKATYEDKFDRRWWVCNKAKRSWVRSLKRTNNRKYRRIKNNEVSKEIETNE